MKMILTDELIYSRGFEGNEGIFSFVLLHCDCIFGIITYLPYFNFIRKSVICWKIRGLFLNRPSYSNVMRNPHLENPNTKQLGF